MIERDPTPFEAIDLAADRDSGPTDSDPGWPYLCVVIALGLAVLAGLGTVLMGW